MWQHMKHDVFSRKFTTFNLFHTLDRKLSFFAPRQYDQFPLCNLMADKMTSSIFHVIYRIALLFFVLLKLDRKLISAKVETGLERYKMTTALPKSNSCSWS